MNPWYEIQERLDQLSASDLLRRPVTLQSPCGGRVIVDGRDVVSLCSNDYLGLANDEAIKAAAIEAIGRWGVGAGASRLVSGTTSLHTQLEERLLAFKGTQGAVVTSTGYMANHVAIHALAGAGDCIFCDKLNHASIIDACFSCGARVRTYPHRDVDRLSKLLDAHRGLYKRCLIVTDSLFSMDGDLAPLRELVELKKRFDAMLLIDEAHATGVLGEHGRGVAELLGVEQDVDVTVGTLSKAMGSMGGFIACPGPLADLIRNSGRTFVYTTALAPAMCAAAIAALDVIQSQPQRRSHLLDLARQARTLLQAAGLNVGGSQTQIIPIIVGQAGAAVAMSRKLLDAGFLVPAIRPPTVPRGGSRLRVSLSADHSMRDVQEFVAALKR